ncbi:MAG: complement resistance protein TraT, partial [Campylobacterales bacterium]
MADETYRSVSDLIIQQKNSSGEWIEIGKTRVISEAVKMGLEPSEAKPAMERQIATKVADIFKK